MTSTRGLFGTEDDSSGVGGGLLVSAVVMGVFASTALQSAIFQPAKGTLANALIPFAIVILLRRGRGVLEAIFVALQFGYVSWYLPLRFHPYLTEAALLEALVFVATVVYFAARPSPWPLLYLAIYHRYWSVRYFETCIELTSGLGLEEVPLARMYIANLLVRWEFIALALIVAFSSKEVRSRSTSWLELIDRGASCLRCLIPLPEWCVARMRLALASRR